MSFSVTARVRAAGVAAAIGGWALFSASAVNATTVIDQSNLVDVTQGALVASGVISGSTGLPEARQVQTITAGLDGILAGIDLQVFINSGGEELQVSLYDGDYAAAQGVAAGTPGGFAPLVGTLTTLDLPTLAQAQAGQLLSLDMTSLNFHVQPGEVFSVLLTAVQGTSPIVGWALGDQPDPNDPNTVDQLDYSGGYNSREQTPGTFSETTADRGFRTEVDVSAAPEPEAWALMLAGFAAVGAAMRHRQRRPYEM